MPTKISVRLWRLWSCVEPLIDLVLTTVNVRGFPLPAHEAALPDSATERALLPTRVSGAGPR